MGCTRSRGSRGFQFLTSSLQPGDRCRYPTQIKKTQMNKSLLTASFLLSLALFVGCSESTDRGAPAYGVVKIEDNDAEMNAAIDSAKDTLEFFEKNWQTMESDGCSLKFAMPTKNGKIEHIWFSPIKIQGNRITGECANDPANIPDLKNGDIRTVSRGDVSDWMIIVGGKCFGGYTIRVLANRNPGAAPPLEFVDPPEN